jgi:hypothetical protein
VNPNTAAVTVLGDTDNFWLGLTAADIPSVVIPEPTGLVMGSIGALSLLGYSRRRKKVA